MAGFDAKTRRFLIWFFAFSIVLIFWKLSVIETDVEKLQFLKDTLYLNKEQLQLTHQQLMLIEHLYQAKVGEKLPIIYAITPTYARLVQKAELTRISQTLQLVPNVHWIIVEDADAKTDLVVNLLIESKLLYTHLTAKTPPFEKLHNAEPTWKKHRGVEQRNAGLDWLRENFQPHQQDAVVYLMDDDNTYSVKLFQEISKVTHVGVWPVGLVGGLNAERPKLDSNNRVIGWESGWRSDRPFAIDMAGFAVHLDLILAKPEAKFRYSMEHGYQESEFLGSLTSLAELQPLADNCRKVLVWHTRTEVPKVRGDVKGLEV